MKKLIIISLFFLAVLSYKSTAQEITNDSKLEVNSEKYGQTLNLGLGIGYYGYVGHSMPVIHADYELNVAKNFTLAPFISAYTYQNYYYWGSNKDPYKNYNYRQTVIPIGLKGSYYFDHVLQANAKWDFYLAGSLGFVIRKTTWENGYYGSRTVHNSSSGLYLNVHIGAEYHMNTKTGLFLDLSSGVSTFGLAIHF